MTEVTSGWSTIRYAEGYHVVSDLEVKNLHDREILPIVDNLLPSGGQCVDFASGPGRISLQLAESRSNCQFTLIDINDSFIGPFRQNVDYIQRDLTVPFRGGSDAKGSAADVGFIVNGWYAMTTPPLLELGGYSEGESLLLRFWSLMNMAQLVKDGGMLIISEPLASSKELGLFSIFNFVKKEYSAGLRGRKGHYVRTFLRITGNLLDPKTRGVLLENKKFMPVSHFFESAADCVNFIENTGLFKVEFAEEGHYLGHNIVLQLRRTACSERTLGVGNTYLISPGRFNIMQTIGFYRREQYRLANVNPNVPLTDEHDLAGNTALVTGENEPILGTLSLSYMSESKRGYDLEAAELVNGGEKEVFIDRVIAQIEKAEGTPNLTSFNIGEVRRFTTNIEILEGLSGREKFKFIDNVLSKLTVQILNAAKERGLIYLVSLMNEGRAKLFNATLKKFNLQLKKLEGFSLDRDTMRTQTILLEGADYFLSDWKTFLDPDEVVIFRKLRTELLENEGVTWDHVAKQRPDGYDTDNIERIVLKLFRKVPDSIHLYYVSLLNAEY